MTRSSTSTPGNQVRARVLRGVGQVFGALVGNRPGPRGSRRGEAAGTVHDRRPRSRLRGARQEDLPAICVCSTPCTVMPGTGLYPALLGRKLVEHIGELARVVGSALADAMSLTRQRGDPNMATRHSPDIGSRQGAEPAPGIDTAPAETESATGARVRSRLRR